jgi:hypothetical protein
MTKNLTRTLASRLGIAALLLGAAPATADDCITIADFARDPVGAFPPSWKVRKDEGKTVYSVQDDGGRRVLRASANDTGIQAAVESPWDLATYPILTWSWRPLTFPRGGDERSSKTNDSALAVYMLVPYSRIRGPKAVKYVWSERVPVGTQLSSNGGLTQVLVQRSGPPAQTGQWVDERVDVLADYKRLFGESDVPKPAGIAVLTDGDDTNSRAEGEYANFRACKR